MRIRTDGEYAHRMDTIEVAADRLDCNKSKAVLIACEVVGPLLDNVEDALENEDISPRVREELAETIGTRQVQIQLNEPESTVELE